MNIRFWHFVHCSPVKITLRPKQVLSHEFGGQTDEGWEAEYITWSHEGDYVHRECVNDGSDCDGRLTRHSEAVCSHAFLKGNFVETNNLAYPDWTCIDAYQRDYAAEAMNY